MPSARPLRTPPTPASPTASTTGSEVAGDSPWSLVRGTWSRTTDISAADRAATVRVAIDPATKPSDLLRPGHMFPLRAEPGGVLKRAGQTEASVDLARIAGLDPSAVLCEVMNEDGTMARVPDLAKFCEKHGFALVTVADLIRHRMKTERLVHRIAAPH